MLEVLTGLKEGFHCLGEGLKKLAEGVIKDPYDQISESSKAKKLVKEDFTKMYGVQSADLQCMVTGVSQNNITPSGGPTPKNPVTLTHLLPRCADGIVRMSLGYDIDDIESMRNSILLCKGIEQAFDQKHISFVPMDNPFQQYKYKLHIWCETARSKPIYEGANETIAVFENHPLNLNVGSSEHNPFNRALSYQAFCAFTTYGIRSGMDFPVNSDVSVYQGSYQQERARYEKQLLADLRKDAAQEQEDEEED